MKLSLGTVQFGMDYGIANDCGRTSRLEVKKILDCARFAGIKLLDTAISYGESEAVLGGCDISRFEIITKLPSLPIGIVDPKRWVVAQIQGSLSRLNVKRIYGVLIHNPSDLMSEKGKALMDGLEILRSMGVISKMGASIYNPKALDGFIGRYPIDIIQAPLNIMDRRLMESGWLSRLKGMGIEVHARSLFLQGLLLIRPDLLPHKFKPWTPLWRSWYEWLDSHNLSPEQGCLGFIKSLPEIDKLIIGVDNHQQLKHLIEAYSMPERSAYPSYGCNDDLLLNPSNWNTL